MLGQEFFQLVGIEIREHMVARGTLADRDDVSYLTVEELVADRGDRDWQDEVEFRRGRRDEYTKMTLPQTWEGVPEPEIAAAAPSEASRELTGTGGSAGVAEGRVRVIDDPSTGALEDGEILVCTTTDPSWAALFLNAGGLVIDVGSPMSHGAIVSRELGLPCVINTRVGTRVLKNGDLVRVDGGAGRVEILETAGGEKPAEAVPET